MQADCKHIQYIEPPSRPVRPIFFSSSGDLKLPGRSKSTKSSPGTATAHCQPTSSDNSIHPLPAPGASTKRKFDAAAPSAMNANKKLKAVHQASQLMTTFQLAQEPKAVAASSEVGHCTAVPQATVTGTPNTFASSAANKEGTYDNACLVLFVQESHTSGKFKELAIDLRSNQSLNATLTNISFHFNLDPMKVMKMAVKQRKALSSLKGKEALDFVPRHLHSSSYGAPFISKTAAQFQSIPSTSKGKSKEVPLHRPTGSIMNKLPASNPASEVSAVTSAASNKPTATNIKAPMSKVKDEEPEEGEIVDPSPPHKIQQTCSSHVNIPSYFKPNEAHDNESLSDSMAKGIPADFTVAPAKRVLSATAPNTSTMEQFKIFTIMFRNLAHTYKQRGDGEQDDLVSALNHLHALCNYIVSYYYKEKQNPDAAPPESVAAWKSLLPLGDVLLAKLQAQEQYLLYGICLRLMAMVHFRIFSKMQDEVRGALVRHLEAPSVSGDHQHVKMSCDLLEEYEQAMAMNASSEKYFNYGVMASKLPLTFKQVCVDGNLLSGITIGEEAGVQVSAIFPFHVNTSLLHGAICTKCILNEFASSINVRSIFIDDTGDYM